MPELEKVVEGLKELRSHFRAMAGIASSMQGRANHIESARTIDDALALLKAQEPRVMTLEEYEAWIDTPFTDRNPVFHEERTKRGTVTCWVNTVVCTLREYGKNDRCWTSRPTDEQREATPWE